MKTFFDTEGSAKRFIEYNSAEIERECGYAPKRAYYCDLCCAWHVTSMEHFKGKSYTRKHIDNYMRLQEQQKKDKDEKRKRKKDALKQEAKETILSHQVPLGKPSESPLSPFMTEAMRLAMATLKALQDAHYNNAQAEFQRLEELMAQMDYVKFAAKTKKRFAIHVADLKRLVDKPEQPTLEQIRPVENRFLEMYVANVSMYNYDPNRKDAIIFELTPDNIKEYIAEIEAENNEQVPIELGKTFSDLFNDILRELWAAGVSMNNGFYEKARMTLLSAVESMSLITNKREMQTLIVEADRLVSRLTLANPA